MNELLPSLAFQDTLDAAPFTELHTRIVDRPIDQVWPHCVEVTAREIRTIGPLMALRGLPTRLRGERPPEVSRPAPLLDVFVEEGFTLLRQDEAPVEGRAVVIFGAASRFWSVTGNAPIPFDSAAEFLAFDEPDFAKTTCRLEAIDLGDGRTLVETETWVNGNDEASNDKFRRYWYLIRLPSGLIRRSWLAAIERRATR